MRLRQYLGERAEDQVEFSFYIGGRFLKSYTHSYLVKLGAESHSLKTADGGVLTEYEVLGFKNLPFYANKGYFEIKLKGGKKIRFDVNTGEILTDPVPFKRTGNRTDGKENGEWKYWDENGRLIIKGTYDKGKPLNGTFWREGAVELYKDGKRLELPRIRGAYMNEIHGLWGGKSLYFTRPILRVPILNANADAWLQVVGPGDSTGLEEKRRFVSLPYDEIFTLEVLLATYNFADQEMKTDGKPLPPDTASTAIRIYYAGGTAKTLVRYSSGSEPNPAFEEIYRWFAEALERLDGKGKLLYSGKYDYKWSPEGFE